MDARTIEKREGEERGERGAASEDSDASEQRV